MEKKNVLIVEDDLAFANFAKLSLRDSQFEIDVARDGRSALEHLEKKKYDLVISDYRLPEIHGIDVLKAAKRNNPHCETVVISAATPEIIGEKLKEVKLFGFLQKPFEPIELRKLVLQALKKLAGEVGFFRFPA